MTAALEQDILAVESADCGRCGTTLVHRRDAIGRVVTRCPKCHGVAPERPRHPDDAMLPQGLVSLRGAVLPPIAPGQLRCQVCARGVDPKDRLCVRCLRERHDAKKAAKAEQWRKDHPPTATARRLCLGCGRTWPRHGGRATTKRCAECPPRTTRRAMRFTPKPCAVEGCGVVFQPGGPRATKCEAHR